MEDVSHQTVQQDWSICFEGTAVLLMFGTALQALETTMAARVFEKIFVALVPRTPIDVCATDRSTEPEVYQSHLACVGVFFWKHGCIEILFSQQRLARFGVRLSSEWDPYLEP